MVERQKATPAACHSFEALPVPAFAFLSGEAVPSGRPARCMCGEARCRQFARRTDGQHSACRFGPRFIYGWLHIQATLEPLVVMIGAFESGVWRLRHGNIR